MKNKQRLFQKLRKIGMKNKQRPFQKLRNIGMKNKQRPFPILIPLSKMKIIKIKRAPVLSNIHKMLLQAFKESPQRAF